ncbi:hypothetical protein E1293_34030 [Actinomadura darangshiensis]|uniref:Uncharacterized protein n=1 Tax=Actinomadura darangshiensis TaxID=705336 RepID=A0A4R5AFK6_9ACTN|nr:hypothetical protein [Actinomadura darangshiensis]TDD71161.1 hypothetical protein E1293_34030 [Actinomadura darangshiensis]
MLTTIVAGPVQADTAPTGALAFAWIIPVLAVIALLAWLYLTIAASSRKVRPERRNDQDNHRGMEQGGLYTYRPGMFSHSYPPDRESQWEEFRKDNPQPGREPRDVGADGILYEQTLFKEEFEELKQPENAEARQGALMGPSRRRRRRRRAGGARTSG